MKKIFSLSFIILIVITMCAIRERTLYNPIRAMYMTGRYREYDTLGRIDGLEMFYSNSQTGPDEKYLKGEYKTEYLKPEFRVYLTFRKEKLLIYSDYELSRECKIHFVFTYNPRNNTLLYEVISVIDYTKYEWGERIVDELYVRKSMSEYNLSEKDIQDMQRYIIYDVVIKSWKNRYGVSAVANDNDTKNLNIEDHTFNFTK